MQLLPYKFALESYMYVLFKYNSFIANVGVDDRVTVFVKRLYDYLVRLVFVDVIVLVALITGKMLFRKERKNSSKVY